MNALEKYAAKSKLIKKLMKKMKKAKSRGAEKLYGKKPKKLPIAAVLGALGGATVFARAAKGRNVRAASRAAAEKADVARYHGMSPLTSAIREAKDKKVGGIGWAGLKGGIAGGKVGREIDKVTFGFRKAKHTERKIKVNLGLGAAAGVTGGGAAALASIIAKKKKSKK